MDLATFLDGLDRYGGDLAAWPAEQRARAEVLMLASQPARAAHVAMGDLERLIRAGSSRARLPATGIDAIAATAMRRPQVRAVSRAMRTATRATLATAAVMTLVLGMALGVKQDQQDDGPDHVLALAFDSAGAVDVD